MIELAGISGPATAFAAGLVTSLHCAGMCGPLACTVMPARADAGDPQVVATCYHLARLAGYGLLGAIVGGLGRAPLLLLGGELAQYLPWLLVVFFAAVALRLDRRLPRIPALHRFYCRLAEVVRRRPRWQAAVGLGAATPLLPCGPLYFLLGLALLSGSAARGAETLVSFGVGTVPLLWLAQLNFSWLRARMSPAHLGRVQSALAAVAAAILVWRLRATLGFEGPGPGNTVCF